MKKHIKHLNNMNGSRNSASGFTLIELLVVVAIIGILSSVVLASLNSARDKARVVRAASDLKQLNLALFMYLDNNGVYPCFDHTWDDTKEKAWSAPYINWMKNPWGNQYHWEHTIQGLTFTISINAPGQANAAALDKIMDDNDLATGIIRGNETRLEYAGMDQTVPFVHCDI